MKIQGTRLLSFALVVGLLGIAPIAQALPFGHGIHLHPRVDERVEVNLHNAGAGFAEIVIGGKTYTVNAYSTSTVKAPIGTVVYAGCGIIGHAKGSVVLVVAKSMDNTVVRLG